MQRIAALIYKYLFFFFPQPHHGGSPPHPWDYAAHFAISLAGVCIIFLIVLFPLKILGVPPRTSLLLSAGITLAVGIAKEISDKNLGKTDVSGDMLADIIGIVIAAIIILLIMELRT